MAAEFNQSEYWRELTPNQQRYAKSIVSQFRSAAEGAGLNWDRLTSGEVGTLMVNEFPRTTDEPRHFYVAVVPVMTAYFTWRKPEQADDYATVLKRTRTAMLAASEEPAPDVAIDQQEAKVDRWLELLDQVPMIENLSDQDQQRVVTILDAFGDLALIGYRTQPVDWSPKLFEAIFFGRFTQLLSPDERTAALFRLLPMTLSVLVEQLKATHQLSEQTAMDLTAWVKLNHDNLVHLSDPQFETYFHKLALLMQQAGIDPTDTTAVDEFTTNYLHEHPKEGVKLFSSLTKGLKPSRSDRKS
ncbi:hypothetical protein [Levilactobacillus bambusae]|uniref:Uncharacterized protein n=1 Tax=Levilactobacillus bambusae TaxID=2024736 RepID=A0A2V1N2Z9_9LACO|nr:hypothetical protein [Levilactobacillus bambusae]PWG00565.1 hypothetical protein DCM90_06485 [Levilactobacillus bambusae]